MVRVFGIVDVQHLLEMGHLEAEQAVVLEIQIQDLGPGDAGVQQLLDFLKAEPGLAGAPHADHHVGLALDLREGGLPRHRLRQRPLLEIVDELGNDLFHEGLLSLKKR